VDAKVRDSLWSVNISGNLRFATGARDLNTYLRVSSDLLSDLSDGTKLLDKLSDHATNTFGLELNFRARLNLLNAIPSTWAGGNLTLESRTLWAAGMVAAPAGSIFPVTAPLIGAFATHGKGDTTWTGLAGGLVVPSIENLTKGAALSESFPSYGFARGSVEFSKLGPGSLKLQVEGALSVNALVNPKAPEIDPHDVAAGTVPDQDAAYRANLTATYSW
jgi:hypothetical protein